MAATVTFTATHEGRTCTRTSGTMAYVAVTLGSQEQWHKSFAAAHKAAVSRTQTYRTGKPAVVVPCYPTAINGKMGDWTPETDGWGDIPASAFTELVAAKQAPKAKAAPKAQPTLAEKIEEKINAEVADAAGSALAWGEAKDGARTAKGKGRTYRVTKAATVPGLYYAAQRGTGGWTPIAGACATQRQAERLAQRYENGERHLSHAKLRGVAYVDLPAAMAS